MTLKWLASSVWSRTLEELSTGDSAYDLLVPTATKALVAPYAIGGFTLLAFLGAAAWWSHAASLSMVTTTPGIIETQSGTRYIQTTYGGTISEVLVAGGDRIRSGQLLMTFDSAASRTKLSDVLTNEADLVATLARLSAERTGASVLSFPLTPPVSLPLPKWKAISVEQEELFAAHSAYVAGKLRASHGEQAASDAELSTVDVEIKIMHQRITLEEAELADARRLYSMQEDTREHLLQVSRTVLDLRSDLAVLAGKRESLALRQSYYRQADVEARTAIVEELQSSIEQTRRDLDDTRQRRALLQDAVLRSEIHAPCDGEVIALRHISIGAQFQPGDIVLDMLPSDQPLVVTAQVSPRDIAMVKLREPVELKFEAGDTVYSPRILGVVGRIASSPVTTRDSGGLFYAVRIDLDGRSNEILNRFPIKNGMPLTVLFVQSAQPVWKYLLDPLFRFDGINAQYRTAA